MKTMVQALETFLNQPAPKFSRFQVYTIEKGQKSKTVGMAYLKEGQNIYTLRLWTFLNDKFFLLQSKEDRSKYMVMTREPSKSPTSKNKFFWNIVGNAIAKPTEGALEINFDLIDKKVYMNLYPEESATPYGQPIPEAALEAA